jgi:hypothetical protein
VMSKPSGVAISRVSTRSFLSDDIDSRFVFRPKLADLLDSRSKVQLIGE